MKMEEIECSETSAYINQTPGNYPKENTLYSEQGESLKSRLLNIIYLYVISLRFFVKVFIRDIFCVCRLTIFICDIFLSNIIFPLQYLSVLSVCLILFDRTISV